MALAGDMCLDDIQIEHSQFIHSSIVKHGMVAKALLKRSTKQQVCFYQQFIEGGKSNFYFVFSRSQQKLSRSEAIYAIKDLTNYWMALMDHVFRVVIINHKWFTKFLLKMLIVQKIDCRCIDSYYNKM